MKQKQSSNRVSQFCPLVSTLVKHQGRQHTWPSSSLDNIEKRCAMLVNGDKSVYQRLHTYNKLLVNEYGLIR